jgi:hypothetical protein
MLGYPADMTIQTLAMSCFLSVSALSAELGAQSLPMSDAVTVWKALQSPVMDPAKSANIQNIVIQRDRVKITLANGVIHFAQPANGVVFAAVFRGSGRVQADPPDAIEASQLRLFTNQSSLNMTFTEATFSFTDGLFDEVGKQIQWSAASPTVDDLYNERQQQREDLGAAYLPRLFKGVYSSDRKRPAFFLADLKTAEKGWVEVVHDAMEQESFRIGRWGAVEQGRVLDVWMSFPATGRNPRASYADPSAQVDFLIPTYQIDSVITDDAELSSTAQVHVKPRYSGEEVLVFNLNSNLRVKSVTAEGHSLQFFQARENKDRFQSYGDYVAVVLPQPTQADTERQIDFQYAGKRVVRKVGSGNYLAESFGWYPAMMDSRTGTGVFAFRSNFQLKFRIPKKYSLVATGNKVTETTEGNVLVSSWRSDVPLAVAGFAFGDYKYTTEKAGNIEIQVYANKSPDDVMRSFQVALDNPIPERFDPATNVLGELSGSPIGNLNVASLAKIIGVETANTLRLFESYFGPYPFKQLAVTNISGYYGQGWPGLLYLTWLTFLDSTQRNALGITQQTELTDFFRAHESSHQWWGHRTSWKSYHDQWLSEGFAEFSGNLYVQYRRSMKDALTQWKKERDKLKRVDLKGHTVESLAPIWLGERIVSSETDSRAYQDLIYSKGGYVLQMIRMMLYDMRNKDADYRFKAMMQEFCKAFENKPASTEDFKAIVEKHMTPSMDLDSNKKMDWFFNQYVYGSGIPQYQFSYTKEPTADGKVKILGKLVRTGVPDNWKDNVPLYGYQGQNLTRIGSITAFEPVTPFEVIVPAQLERFSVNALEDMLADVRQ